MKHTPGKEETGKSGRLEMRIPGDLKARLAASVKAHAKTIHIDLTITDAVLLGIRWYCTQIARGAIPDPRK